MSTARGSGVGLDPAAPRALPALSWWTRALDTLGTYLPLLLMALLALGTWWLVKNTPLFDAGRPAPPPRHEPDYTMTQFTVQRYLPSGAIQVQLEGDLLRHYPDTDTIEIENPRIRSVGPDGKVTRASAKRAIANGDVSEVQLLDAAHVVREKSATEAETEFRGEFLQAFLNTEKLRSHLPVTITQGTTVLRTGTMDYDNLSRVVDFGGRSRAVFESPRSGARPR